MPATPGPKELPVLSSVTDKIHAFLKEIHVGKHRGMGPSEDIFNSFKEDTRHQHRPTIIQISMCQKNQAQAWFIPCEEDAGGKAVQITCFAQILKEKKNLKSIRKFSFSRYYPSIFQPILPETQSYLPEKYYWAVQQKDPWQTSA